MSLCTFLGALVGGAIGVGIGYLIKPTVGKCVFTDRPLKGMIIGAIAGFLFASIVLCGRFQDAEYDGYVKTGGLTIETIPEFRQLVLKSQQPVLVDFYSPSCPPCRELAPKIASLKKKYDGRAGVYKVNVTRLPKLATEYRVRRIPIVIFFNGGKEVRRVLGNNWEFTYARILDKMIKEEENREKEN